MSTESRPSSQLLINEPPLQVLPSLAVQYGLNEAIFIQQLHWMLRSKEKGKVVGATKWVYNTMEEWRDVFPFWSLNTIRRIIDDLVKVNVVLEGNYNDELSRRKWYAINYEILYTISPRKARKKRDDYPNFGDTMKGKRRTSKVRTIDDPKLGHTIIQTLDVDLSETSNSKTLYANSALASSQENKTSELDGPVNSKELDKFLEKKTDAATERLSQSIPASKKDPEPVQAAEKELLKESGVKESSSTALAPVGYRNFYLSEQGRRTLHLVPDGSARTLCGVDSTSLLELKRPDDGLDYSNYQSRQCDSCGDKFSTQGKPTGRVSPVLAQVVGATDPVFKESPYGHNSVSFTPLTLHDCELAGELRFKAKADVWVEWGNWCDEVHITDQQPARLAFFKGWDKSREEWNKARFEEIGKAPTPPDLPQPIPFLALPPVVPARPAGAEKYNQLKATLYYAVNHTLKQVALSPAEQYVQKLSTPGWVHEMGIVIKTSESYLEYAVIPRYPDAPQLNGQGGRTDDLPQSRPTNPETKQEPSGGVFALPTFANLKWYTCSGENLLVHLAKPTPSGQRLKPICGVKGHSASPVEASSLGNRQPCPGCQRIATERTAKAERVKFRKPQLWDPLFDSTCAGLAGHKECTPADRVAFGWRAGKIIHGDDERGCDGLIVYECAWQGKTAENLDYKVLATTMDLFWPNFHRYHPDLDLKDCVKFIEYWGQFRVAQDGKQKKTVLACPKCNGQRVTFIDDPDEPGQKLAIPCECQKAKVS